MKFAFVIEDDIRFQEEISAAIIKADKEIQIRIFETLEQFFDWTKGVVNDTKQAFIKAGITSQAHPNVQIKDEAHSLVLLVSKIEFFGSDQIPLLKKLRELFIRKGLCTKEDPAAVVLTTFSDSPGFAIEKLEDKIITNVICKPFDKLILEQHLIFAISGRHPPSVFSIANQKVTAIIEMLKDVQLEAMSEVGFVTRSYRKMEVGKIAKYYAEPFHSERKRSIIAVLVSCTTHPSHQKEFRCVFRFLGPNHTQISQLRRLSRVDKDRQIPFDWLKFPLKTKVVDRKVEVILIDRDQDSSDQIKSILQRRFSNLTVHHFTEFTEFLGLLDPALSKKEQPLQNPGGAAAQTNAPPTPPMVKSNKLRIPAHVDVILTQHQLMDSSRFDLWVQIQKKFTEKGQNPVYFCVSGTEFSDNDTKKMGEFVSDIFYRPYDRNYLAQRLIASLPDLKVAEDAVDFPTIKMEKVIRTANPVKISEMSEAGLKLNYYREISPGSFRQFVLWQPYEYGAPELVASCNFSEPGPNKDFINHFVFFGVSDFYLRGIRLWLVENYVHSKNKS